MERLQLGDTAPDFQLSDQDQRTVRLADYRGRKVLVYFYPKADTPGCTTQSCSVRDAAPDFKGLGIDVLGISPDPPARQKAFDEKYRLGFPLLSDPDHRIAEAYSAWGEKTSYGKTTLGILRSAFLIDEQGRILLAAYKVKPEDTVPKAREALEE